MSDIAQWSTSAGSNSQPSPNGFPEGMPPSGVNDASREVMAAIKRWYDAVGGLNINAATAGDSQTLAGQTLQQVIDAAVNAVSGGGNAANALLLQGNTLAQVLAAARDRATHTGTQLLSTISNAGLLAGKNTVGTSDIDNGAVTDPKIGNVNGSKIINQTLLSAKFPQPIAGTLQPQMMYPVSCRQFGSNGNQVTFQRRDFIALQDGQIRITIRGLATVFNSGGNDYISLVDSTGTVVAQTNEFQPSIADAVITANIQRREIYYLRDDTSGFSAIGTATASGASSQNDDIRGEFQVLITTDNDTGMPVVN